MAKAITRPGKGEFSIGQAFLFFLGTVAGCSKLADTYRHHPHIGLVTMGWGMAAAGVGMTIMFLFWKRGFQRSWMLRFGTLLFFSGCITIGVGVWQLGTIPW